MSVQNAITTITAALAKKLDISGSSEDLIQTLKATAFKGNVSDEQMTALMVVANQYSLNPWTKEIYAFPDKGGIVPVVGVDGWSKIINQHPDFDGVTFEQGEDFCVCSIYRKSRQHPTRITEFMQECARPTGPWKSHPRRMLRHKAFIQCARLAFGYVGIYDADEAARIVEARAAETPRPVHAPAPDVVDVQVSPAPASGAFYIQTHLEKITAAPTLEALREAAVAAWQASPKDDYCRAKLKDAHDARKYQLKIEAENASIPEEF